MPSGPGRGSDTSARIQPLATHPPLEIVLLHVAHLGTLLRRTGIQKPRLSPSTASSSPTSLLWRQRKMAPHSVRSAHDTARGAGPCGNPTHFRHNGCCCCRCLNDYRRKRSRVDVARPRFVLVLTCLSSFGWFPFPKSYLV